MNNLHPIMQAALAPFAPPPLHQTLKTPRFAVTYCSSCGEEFGPGDSGYSQCSQHGDGPTAEELAEHRAWLLRAEASAWLASLPGSAQ